MGTGRQIADYALAAYVQISEKFVEATADFINV